MLNRVLPVQGMSAPVTAVAAVDGKTGDAKAGTAAPAAAAALPTTDALLAQLPVELRAGAARVLSLGAAVRAANIASQLASKPLTAALVSRLNAKRFELFDKLYDAAMNVWKASDVKSKAFTSAELSAIDSALTAYFGVIQLLKRAVSEHNGLLADLSANPPGAKELAAAIATFNAEFEVLSAAAKAHKPAAYRLPFQIEYSASMDPVALASTGEVAVVFAGDKIFDRFGRDIWQDVCVHCQYEIQSGGYGVGVRRTHCMDCSTISVCYGCRRASLLVQRVLSERLQPAAAAVVSTDSKSAAAVVTPATLIARILEVDPHLTHALVEERNHTVFARLSLPTRSSGGGIDGPNSTAADFNLARVVNACFKIFADRPCFGTKQVDAKTNAARYQYLNYTQVRNLTIPFACALAELVPESKYSATSGRAAPSADAKASIGGPQFVGICSTNRLEWYVCDLACVLARVTSVGLQHLWPLTDLQHVINLTKLTVIVCSRDMAVKFASSAFLAAAPTLRTLIVFDEPNDSAAASAALASSERLQILRFRDLSTITKSQYTTRSGVALLEPELIDHDDDAADWKANGILYAKEGKTEPPPPPPKAKPTVSAADEKKADAAAAAARDDFLFTLIFTSGSTGKPKGAMVLERVWESDCNIPELETPNVRCSFLPSAWGADRGTVWSGLLNGGRIAFSDGGATLFEDLKLCAPTTIMAPPAVWNSLYADYHMALKRTKTTEEKDKLILRFRSVLGDRLVNVATGSAPISEPVLAWLKMIFKVDPLVGYGCTECAQISTNNVIDRSAEVRLLDVPELGYFSKNGEGEIAVRTPHVIPGYYADPASTAESITADGFFITGDIGRRHSTNGTITIIDRRKMVFKLAVGEMVSPAKLETGAYADRERCPSFEQICIYGDSTRHSVIAIAVPTLQRLQQFADAYPTTAGDVKSVPATRDSYRQLLSDVRLHTELLAELHAAGTNASFRPYELPHGIVLCPEPFSVEAGTLTPSMKLQRHAIRERYKSQINSLYDTLEAKPGGNESRSTTLTRQLSASKPHTISVRVYALASAILGLREPFDPLLPANQTASFSSLGGASLEASRFLFQIRELLSSIPSRATAEPPSAQFLLQSPLVVVAQTLEDGTSTKAASQWQSAELKSLAESMDRDTLLGDAIIDELKAKPAADTTTVAAAANGVLLTGATGFLGAHVISELLDAAPSRVIHCLVRCSDEKSGLSRLRESMTRYGRWQSEYSTRLRVVPCALIGAKHFGLTETAFRALNAACNSVYHLAADTNFNAPYSVSRQSNVLSAVEVLRFAVAGAAPLWLHHISTLSVFGRYSRPDTRLREDMDLFSGGAIKSPVLGADGYSASKWVAEVIMNRARARGLPISVCRMGFVSWAHRAVPRLVSPSADVKSAPPSAAAAAAGGDAKSAPITVTITNADVGVAATNMQASSGGGGQSNADDWLTRLIRAVLHMHCYPITEASRDALDLVSVDYVAACIVRASARIEAATKRSVATTYHIVGPSSSSAAAAATAQRFTFRQLIASVRTFHGFDGARLLAIPYSEFMDRVRAEGPTNPLFPLIPYFENGFPSGGAFDDTALHQLVAASTKSPIPEPVITEARVHEHVRWLLAFGLAKLPKLSTALSVAARKKWSLASTTISAANAFLSSAAAAPPATST